MYSYISILSIIGLFIGFALFFPGLLKTYWNSEKIIKNPLTYYILLINFIIATCLPISLWIEFPEIDGAEYAPFSYYYMNYPHMVIFPALFFSFAGLFTMRTACLYWAISKRAVIARVAISCVISGIVLFYEATGGAMMLFEFNKAVQSNTKQFQDGDVRSKINDLGIGDAFYSPMAEQVINAKYSPEEENKIAGALNNYKAWSKLDEDWASDSRPVYLVVFLYMIFTLIISFSFLPPIRNFHFGNKKMDLHISLNLIGIFIIFLMWIPFRVYYNINTKIPIFGENITNNFLGDIPFFNIFGITSSEILPSFFIIIFLFFLIIRKTEVSRLILTVSISIIGFTIVIGSTILAIFKPDIFIQIYGLDGELKYFIFRILLFSSLSLLIYSFIFIHLYSEKNDKSNS